MNDAIRTQQRAARRDPEGRRSVIIAAAAELIAETGVNSLTHRVIAHRAGVPLGSTTYYFPTLDDLTLQALRKISGTHSERLDAWKQRLLASPDASTVIALMEAYLENRRAAAVEYEVYAAAARRPELRPLATEWAQVLLDALEPALGVDKARGVAFMFDGVTLNALMTGAAVDRDIVLPAVAALLAA